MKLQLQISALTKLFLMFLSLYFAYFGTKKQKAMLTDGQTDKVV